METLIALVIVTITTIRITRLITIDKIGEPARSWVTSRLGEQSPWTFLIHCPWCTGYWVALPAAAVMWAWTTLPQWVDLPPILGFLGLWSALAYVTGYVLTNVEGR